MLIFIDSNILCSDFYLKGALFKIIQKIGTIVLGQIVVDEVCNKYREKLEEHLQKLNVEIKAINRMIETPIALSTDGLIESEVKNYKDFLEMFPIKNGMTVAEDYPTISHQEVVNRALERKKPFKEDGSTGYRDYLVWRTCLDLARMYQYEEIHFITQNVKDFSNPSDKTKLHDDLLYDLEEQKIDISRFHYWISLKSFVDEYAKARVEEIEQRENLISEIENNKSGFSDLIQDYIDNSLVGIELSGYDVLVPGEEAVIKRIEEFYGCHIENIVDVNESEYLLDVCIDSIGIVESYSNIVEISEFEDCEDFDIRIIERYKNNKCLIETIIGVHIHLSAIYHRDTNTIVSIQLDDIEDDNCPYCSY